MAQLFIWFSQTIAMSNVYQKIVGLLKHDLVITVI